MDIEKFKQRISLIKIDPLAIAPHEVDEFVLWIGEQEKKLELLKELKNHINDRIHEMENALKDIKLKVASQIDGKLSGVVYDIGVRKMKVYNEQDLTENAVYKYIVIVTCYDEDTVKLLTSLLPENMYEVKKEIDIQKTKEKLQSLNKVYETKTLVIYNKKNKMEE